MAEHIPRRTRRAKLEEPEGPEGQPAAERSVALVPVEQRRVALLDGNEVVAVKIPQGDIYLPVRALCASLGLEYTGQRQRLRRDQALAEGVRTVRIDTPGGTQAMPCLLLEYVPYWLSTVDLERVRAELRPRLLLYKRQVIGWVWAAFAGETGLTAAAPTASAEGGGLSLEQIEQLGLALATLARQQLAFEQQHQQEIEAVHGHLAAHDDRLDRAAQVMRTVIADVRSLQARLAPGNVISDERAAEISTLVKAIATAITRRGAQASERRPNAYQAIFAELYRRFRVSSYKLVRTDQYDEVIAWLRAYQQDLDVEGQPGTSGSGDEDPR